MSLLSSGYLHSLLLYSEWGFS